MSPIRRSSIAAILVSLASAQSMAAQAPASAEPARVLVLGTYHFANPGLDVVKTEVADVLSAPKQAEIRTVVEGLTRFQPTRIAVESVPAAAPRVDSLYDAYRSGRHELDRNETEQLGFRMAAMLDHSRVYPIDHLARDHGTYMRFAEVGAGDTYVGAELLSKWYERNVHMFANPLRIAEPGERILVIVGSGHAPILRELITYHPEMRLVNTLEYLSPE